MSYFEPGIAIAKLAAAVAEPLLSKPPTKKSNALAEREADRIHRLEDGTEPPAAADAAAESAVSIAVSTQQIVRLAAEPALSREPAGYRCVAVTRVTLHFADGAEAAYTFDDGTVLAVDHGLLHLPTATLAT